MILMMTGSFNVMLKMSNLRIGKTPHFTPFKTSHLDQERRISGQGSLSVRQPFHVLLPVERLRHFSSFFAECEKSNFVLHWMERGKIREKAAEMRLF